MRVGLLAWTHGRPNFPRSEVDRALSGAAPPGPIAWVSTLSQNDRPTLLDFLFHFFPTFFFQPCSGDATGTWFFTVSSAA
jgi:hypothetical protein